MPLFFCLSLYKRLQMINSVRNTVLAILNKNNYGYIAPNDFNLYAKQAQLDLFEDYFPTLSKSLGGYKPAIARTIPINTNLKQDYQIQPYENLTEMLEADVTEKS